MFSRSKKEPEKKPRRDLSQVNFHVLQGRKKFQQNDSVWLTVSILFTFPQFGIFDIPDINLDGGGDDDDTDSDMEAELARITAGSGQPKRRAKPKPQPNVDLDRMVAESLRDVDLDDDDDIDENDPDLLNELSEIVEPEEMEQDTAPAPTPKAQSNVILPTTNSMPDLLKARIEMYKLAEANAKAANDSSKARRIGRGLKTLETMYKQASAGKTINPDEIPPEVATGGAKPQSTATSNDNDETPVLTPARAAPAIPNTPAAPASPPEPISFTPTSDEPPKPDNSEKIALLLARQREYKVAALAAKKSGDTEKALGFVKISKMFDAVIKAAQDGQPVDLSDMPPPPSEVQAQMERQKPAETEKEESQTQNATEDVPAAGKLWIVLDRMDWVTKNWKFSVPTPPEEVLVTATTVLEALTQRLDKYKSVEQAAKDEGNSSKARR